MYFTIFRCLEELQSIRSIKKYQRDPSLTGKLNGQLEEYTHFLPTHLCTPNLYKTIDVVSTTNELIYTIACHSCMIYFTRQGSTIILIGTDVLSNMDKNCFKTRGKLWSSLINKSLFKNAYAKMHIGIDVMIYPRCTDGIYTTEWSPSIARHLVHEPRIPISDWPLNRTMRYWTKW